MMAIIRAHVAALGGNALLSYQMSECVLEDNVHKNQVCAKFLKNIFGGFLFKAECHILWNQSTVRNKNPRALCQF